MRALGCVYGQGYYFAHPLTEVEIEAPGPWLMLRDATQKPGATLADVVFAAAEPPPAIGPTPALAPAPGSKRRRRPAGATHKAAEVTERRRKPRTVRPKAA